MNRALLRPQYLPSAALRSAVVRRVALAWLLLALVVVPTLGRLHQVVHGGALDQAHAGGLAAPSPLPGCRVPCDYLPRRSWPLFKARAVLRGLLASNDLESTS